VPRRCAGVGRRRTHPPLQLAPHERRLHVRHTLLKDRPSRIENRPEAAQHTFDALAADPYVFFRATLFRGDHNAGAFRYWS
jgi:hypothetical protein